MKFMRERLFEIVAGLSLRRAASVYTAPSTRSTVRYPYAERTVSAPAYVEDADDEFVPPRPEPLKLRKKPKRRALG